MFHKDCARAQFLAGTLYLDAMHTHHDHVMTVAAAQHIQEMAEADPGEQDEQDARTAAGVGTGSRTFGGFLAAKVWPKLIRASLVKPISARKTDAEFFCELYAGLTLESDPDARHWHILRAIIRTLFSAAPTSASAEGQCSILGNIFNAKANALKPARGELMAFLKDSTSGTWARQRLGKRKREASSSSRAGPGDLYLGPDEEEGEVVELVEPIEPAQEVVPEAPPAGEEVKALPAEGHRIDLLDFDQIYDGDDDNLAYVVPAAEKKNIEAKVKELLYKYQAPGAATATAGTAFTAQKEKGVVPEQPLQDLGFTTLNDDGEEIDLSSGVV